MAPTTTDKLYIMQILLTKKAVYRAIQFTGDNVKQIHTFVQGSAVVYIDEENLFNFEMPPIRWPDSAPRIRIMPALDGMLRMDVGDWLLEYKGRFEVVSDNDRQEHYESLRPTSND